jgi:hypothetical protein
VAIIFKIVSRQPSLKTRCLSQDSGKCNTTSLRSLWLQPHEPKRLCTPYTALPKLYPAALSMRAGDVRGRKLRL